MARRNFNTANYLASSNSPVNAIPLTIACWARPNSAAMTSFNVPIRIVSTGSGWIGLTIQGGVSNKPWLYSSNSTSNITHSATIGDAIDGVWQHVAGVSLTTTNRLGYLNGIPGTASTSTNDPGTAFNSVAVGTGVSNYGFNGDIADVCIWNISLTATEIALLATGVSPFYVRPRNLVAYYPLDGRKGPGEPSLIREEDYLNKVGTSATNAVVVNDPLKALRNRAKPANIPLFRPYPRIYYVAGPNSTWATPTSTQIINGQLSGGGAATASWSESAPLQTTTPFNFSQPASPLTTGTKYRAAAVQKAGDSNVVSNVVESDPFLAGAATLSNPEAVNITDTAATPKVTVSY